MKHCAKCFWSEWGKFWVQICNCWTMPVKLVASNPGLQLYRVVQKSVHPRNSMDVRFFGALCTWQFRKVPMAAEVALWRRLAIIKNYLLTYLLNYTADGVLSKQRLGVSHCCGWTRSPRKNPHCCGWNRSPRKDPHCCGWTRSPRKDPPVILLTSGLCAGEHLMHGNGGLNLYTS